MLSATLLVFYHFLHCTYLRYVHSPHGFERRYFMGIFIKICSVIYVNIEIIIKSYLVALSESLLRNFKISLFQIFLPTRRTIHVRNISAPNIFFLFLARAVYNMQNILITKFLKNNRENTIIQHFKDKYYSLKLHKIHII